MNYKDIVFDSIGRVRVYVPPTEKVRQILNQLYPVPKPPIKTDKTATGKEISMEIIDDPEYLAEKERIETARTEKSAELNLLFAFRDLSVPAEWDGPDPAVIEVIQYADSSYTYVPRKGAQGRKLDYIEWCVLESPADQRRYTNALYALMGLDLDLTAQIEESFQDNVEGPTA